MFETYKKTNKNQKELKLDGLGTVDNRPSVFNHQASSYN